MASDFQGMKYPEKQAPFCYMDENQNSQEFTSDKRAMETMQLIPDGGSSHDYEFSYAAGELEVKHHVLRDGYVIEGKKVKG